MQSIPKQLKPALRWSMRWAIGFALACSVFSAGSARGQETGATQVNVETIKNQTYAIMQDVDALRSQVEMIVDDVDVLTQLEYWFRSVSNAIDSFDTYVRAGVDLRPDTLNVFKDYFDSVEASMTSIRRQLLGVGTVTNFLGESSGPAFHTAIQNDVAAAIRAALGFPPNGFNGVVTSAPFMAPSSNVKTIGEWASEVFGGTIGFTGSSVSTNVLAYLQYILNALSAPQDMAATTNVLNHLAANVTNFYRGFAERWEHFSANVTNFNNGFVQNLVVGSGTNRAIRVVESEEVRTTITSISNAVSSVYELLEEVPSEEDLEEALEADTYTNAVPSDPLEFGVIEVDTKSMESVLDPITHGLEGLIPIETTTKPKIVMMQGRNRSQGNVEVELNLDGLEPVTRVLRVLYKVGLWVGVIGILRSEWAFWSTLGGSAT